MNKIHISPRCSGETILRYVAEAPLLSLRADLSLVPRPGAASSSTVSFAAGASDAASNSMNARIQKLEAATVNIESTVQAQGQDVVGLATGFARIQECS